MDIIYWVYSNSQAVPSLRRGERSEGMIHYDSGEICIEPFKGAMIKSKCGEGTWEFTTDWDEVDCPECIKYKPEPKEGGAGVYSEDEEKDWSARDFVAANFHEDCGDR
jgi:hypothetical protein